MLMKGFDVIINSTTSGLSGQLPEVSEIIFNSNGTVYDMVYGSNAYGIQSVGI